MNTYLIPGLGADKRMYEGQLKHLKDAKVLEFKEPLPNETLKEYAIRLAEGIDKTQDFQLVGVSMGGIMSQEIAAVYKPKQIVLISTVKSREELPIWIKFFKYFPLQKIVPGKFYLWAFMVLVWFRTLFKRSNSIIGNLKNMAKDANPTFVYWAVDKVINWQEPIKDFKAVHVHGTKDTLFPIRRIKRLNYALKDGTHAMVLTHVREINEVLDRYLK